MTTKQLFSFAFAALFASSVFAQLPSLQVRGGNQQAQEVYLKDLDVKIDVVGNIATTTLTMVFQNRSNRVLEGELLFPLPDGVSVSRYALDINGRMREAVPVDKSKGTQVFEEIEQRRVDPGLMERVEGNNFRTRIYPIPANGSRTIIVGYEQQLQQSEQGLGYHMPMDYKQAIDKFALKATVHQAPAAPKVDGNIGKEFQFDREGTAYIAQFSRTNYRPAGQLSFSLPNKANDTWTITQPASGSYYFTATCTPESKVMVKTWPDVLGIVWDVSYSARKRNLDAELAIIDAIVMQKKELTIKLALLNHLFAKAGEYRISNANWSELRNALQSAEYDGGTRYEAIDLSLISAQEYILFSDGMSTLSDATIADKSLLATKTYDLSNNKGHRIHAVVSTPLADYSSLKFIVAKTGGKFIDLNSLTKQQALEEIGNETLHFLGIKPNYAVREVYPSLPTPVGKSFSLAGIAITGKVDLVLQFGYGGKVSMERTLSLDASTQATSSVNVHKLWAQKKIAELDINYKANKDELTELGQEFGIVTRNTSLIVLETVQDYIRYEISPPAELQTEYMQWKKNTGQQQAINKKNFLNEAIASAAKLKEWWNMSFEVKGTKYPKPDAEVDAQSAPARSARRRANTQSARQANISTDEMVIEEDNIRMPEADFMADARSMRVMLDATTAGETSDEMSKSSSRNTAASSAVRYRAQAQARITLTDIKQDKEYLKKLTGKLTDDYKTYLSQRNTYGGTPDYFFDMANWFMQKGDRAKAISVLTCIADLGVENADLFRLLGYRLKEYGEYTLQEYVCRKVVEWRPMEPQSHRDLALALADNGKAQQALNMLYATITQQYANNINTASHGIDLVLATEINQLLALNKKLKRDSIDKRLLVGPLPVDIRVVINWNMNNTDIDLHVEDPRGETCYYRNNQTAIGGIISADITRGYGPEQFMLKKAIKGKYKVSVNYFGDTQVKSSGPSTIMAEIFTSYSDSSQTRRVVCLQLNKATAKSGLLQVAEFEF